MAVNSRIGGFGIPARALGLVGAGYSQAQTATASGVGDVESAEYSHIGAMGMPRVAYPASIPNKYGGAVTITGSGTPTATTATASGVAGLRWNASGTPQATTSTVSGAGARVITGAASAGWFGPHWFGPHWFNDVWFTETPTADRADVALSQSSIRLISATVSATRATATGVGLRLIDGTGAPTASTATSSGLGVRANDATGSGAVQAITAFASGAGLKVVIATGAPQAGAATNTSITNLVVSGSGAVQAATAIVVSRPLWVPTTNAGTTWTPTTNTGNTWTDAA